MNDNTATDPRISQFVGRWISPEEYARLPDDLKNHPDVVCRTLLKDSRAEAYGKISEALSLVRQGHDLGSSIRGAAIIAWNLLGARLQCVLSPEDLTNWESFIRSRTVLGVEFKPQLAKPGERSYALVCGERIQKIEF